MHDRPLCLCLLRGVRPQVNFFKVQEIKAAEGSMQLKVWVRMEWVDKRLAWDPSDYGNLTKAYFAVDPNPLVSEVSEVWSPDVQPYNAIKGIVNTLEPTTARVSSDGSVFMSRPGTLEVMCKFSGLVAFPFDRLRCSIEFGGWSFSAGQMGIKLMNDGYVMSTMERTSGTSYQEYKIQDVKVEEVNYEYPCCPSEPWPVILYHVTLSRAYGFYNTVSVIPGVLITLLSFAVFWCESNSTDALAYGITVIVVNLLSNIVLLEMLPVCGEMIWIDIFALCNTFFCCVSLLQSALCLHLEGCEDDHLLPLWFVYSWNVITKHVRARLGLRTVAEARKKAAEARLSLMHEQDKRLSKQDLASIARLASNGIVTESVAGMLYRNAASEGGVGEESHALMHMAGEGRESHQGEQPPVQRPHQASRVTFGRVLDAHEHSRRHSVWADEPPVLDRQGSRASLALASRTASAEDPARSTLARTTSTPGTRKPSACAG